MNVLFISIPFREYVSEIKKTISVELDAHVDLVFCDIRLPFYKRLINRIIMGKNSEYYNYKHQKKYFGQIVNKKYDYIFVLVGRNLNIEEFSFICKKNKQARKILFLWDDVARVNTFENIKNYFDIIYSSDSLDCKKYNFSFLPLFYCSQFIYKNENKSFDLSCIGQLHSSREKYLINFSKLCIQYNLKKYFLLQASVVQILKEFIRRHRLSIPNFIKINGLTLKECSYILKKSKCVVDMPHSSQSGLTIRSIEALASRTKIITTNKEIINYDFYNENNILVTDQDCSNFNIDFLLQPYFDIDEKIIEKYSIDSWIRNIFLGDK